MLYVALNEQLLDILLNLIVGYVPPGLIYCTGPRMCSGGGITHFLLGFFLTCSLLGALATHCSEVIYF